MKSCCFIGHRKINITNEIREELKKIIEDLIVSYNVKIFNFGSRSDFDTLCHEIVTELRVKFHDIKRVSFTCQSEGCILEKDREYWQRLYSDIRKEDVSLLGVEEEYEHKNKYLAGKASYIERNYSMIDNSDFCIFYYDINYTPETTSTKKKYIYPKSKSGTKIAFEYAKRKKKKIINIYNYKM